MGVTTKLTQLDNFDSISLAFSNIFSILCPIAFSFILDNACFSISVILHDSIRPSTKNLHPFSVGFLPDDT